MAYTVNQLITASYYLSGIVARELQTVSGQQITDGLYLLNSLLAVKTADRRMIPYFTNYQMDLVQNNEMYFIPNLISIEAITFNQSVVRYAMVNSPRKQYFGAPRVDNIGALPFTWHLERTLGGSNLWVYFLPIEAFVLKFIGKFFLSNVTLEQDLEAILDQYYIEYLRYALAEYICSDYNITFQPRSQSKLDNYEQLIMDTSPIDFTQVIVSTLNKSGGYNWGDVNLGQGWRPN